METVGERLKYYIEKEGFTVRAFAQKFSMNYSGLTQIIANERPLGMNILKDLKAALPKIDTEWLIFGTNREYPSDNDSIVVSTDVREMYLADPGEKMLLEYLDRESIQEKLKSIFSKM